MYGFVKILLPLYGIYNLIYSKKRRKKSKRKRKKNYHQNFISLFQVYRKLGTEMLWTLSLSIPDSTNSCTPVPATRGYRGALYKFSMNHWQWNLQMETGPNVTQFLQVSITLHRFLGAPSVFSKQRWFGGRCTMAQKKGGKEKRRRAKYMHQGL